MALDPNDVHQRLREIESELADLYSVDLSEQSKDKLRDLAQRSRRLEAKRKRLRGWLNTHTQTSDEE